MEKGVLVGRLSDLQEGEIVSYEVEGEQVAVVKINDRVYAVEDNCSHADCPLSEGMVEECTIICPCHAAGFELETGEPTNPPAVEPIRCFAVTIESDDIYIRI